MFAFGTIEDQKFVFVQNRKKHVYTWADVKTAREFWESVKNRYHLYEIDNDLSCARLIEIGGNEEAPLEVTLDEDQKLLLYKSYVYKSLLAWFPPEEML